MEKISLGTHLPHPLWVITPCRISRLTPDLAKGRHWKENSSPSLYPHLCLLQEPKLREGYFFQVCYCVCTVVPGQSLPDRGTWGVFFYSPSHHMKGRWGEAGGSFTARWAVGSSSKQAARKCCTTLSLLGAFINKRGTMHKDADVGNFARIRREAELCDCFRKS